MIVEHRIIYVSEMQALFIQSVSPSTHHYQIVYFILTVIFPMVLTFQFYFTLRFILGIQFYKYSTIAKCFRGVFKSRKQWWNNNRHYFRKNKRDHGTLFIGNRVMNIILISRSVWWEVNTTIRQNLGETSYTEQ